MPDTPTPRLGLVAPLGGDQINQGDDSLRALVARLDAVLAPVSSGLLANRPVSTAGSPGITDRRYYATDIGLGFRDTGIGWVPEGIPIGATFGWIAAADLTAEIVLADGRTLPSANYSALDALIGAAAPSPRTHLWNGGVSPGAGLFRIPDYRGRARVAPDDMGTGQGAAGRLPNSNRALGQSGGEERHAQTIAELAAHNHHEVTRIGTTSNNSAVDNNDAPLNASGGTPRTPANTTTDTVGSGTPFNVMQPYAVENVLVRII